VKTIMLGFRSVGPEPNVSSVLRRWVRDLPARGVRAAWRQVRRILGGVFLREGDPGWILPRENPARSIRLFRVLGRKRRLEGTLAVDLGRLADAAHREGLDLHARRFARGAFDHWCRARRAGEHLRRKVEQALERRSL
jgi:hypothetical protein